MKNKKLVVSVALVLTGFMLTGCFGVNTHFANIRSTFIDNLDCRFKKEIEFSVGPAGIMFAGAFVRFADENIELEEILDDVSRVQVGIYEPLDFIEEDLSIGMLNALTEDLLENGWSSLVKSISNGELTGIFMRTDDENNPVGILVISLSDDELVIAEISGDLEKLMETIAEKENFSFEITNN